MIHSYGHVYGYVYLYVYVYVYAYAYVYVYVLCSFVGCTFGVRYYLGRRGRHRQTDGANPDEYRIIELLIEYTIYTCHISSYLHVQIFITIWRFLDTCLIYLPSFLFVHTQAGGGVYVDYGATANFDMSHITSNTASTVRIYIYEQAQQAIERANERSNACLWCALRLVASIHTTTTLPGPLSSIISLFGLTSLSLFLSSFLSFRAHTGWRWGWRGWYWSDGEL